MKSGNNIADAIYNFDLFLYQEGYGRKFEAVIIGGAALILMGVTNRETRDVDFIDPIIPSELKYLSAEFMRKNPHYGLNQDTWINNGPISIVEYLPVGWQNRLKAIFEGKILKIWTLGRIDLLKTKLLACADRDDPDFEDCLNLCPTIEELRQCKDWVVSMDGSEFWPARVEDIFFKIQKALGHV